jgi:alanine-glyoxylate transaminase/serine-glyoxylate transaminase/serine-pyruvate transaminase
MDVTSYHDLNVSSRILLGPGPSMVPPRVLAAMASPVIGHLDPEFLTLMQEVQHLLRFIFQSENELTVPVSGTGSAGMESSLCNLIEPGDQILIAVLGYFGERMVEMAGRYGAQVDRIDRPWGEVFDPDEIIAALSQKQYKLLALVHGETSTGVQQPDIVEIAAAAQQNGTLVVLDTVASLGGVPVEIDSWGVDVAFSATQKSLSAPPGLAPVTISSQAREVLRNRSTPVGNWYLDLSLLEKYWGDERTYHHTAPINMNYALREVLRLAAEEGLEARFSRHQANAEMLWAGLEELDISLLVPAEYRLPTLTTAIVPPGIDALEVRQQLLKDYNIEIAGGFGPLAGKIWRIGLMGFSSRREHVLLLLAALREILQKR